MEQKQENQSPKKSRQEKWEEFKALSVASLFMVGGFLAADYIPDESLDGLFFWDSKEWNQFWQSEATPPTENPPLPNIDNLFGD